MTNQNPWLVDALDAISEARRFAGLLDHLGTSEFAISSDDLDIVETGIRRALDRVEAFLDTERKAHAAAKAAPGSAEAQQQVDGLYAILSSAVAVVADGCHEAGFELPGWTKEGPGLASLPYPSRSTIFRTGLLVMPSMPVSSSARPALPPQPSWRMRLMISRSAKSRRLKCVSVLQAKAARTTDILARHEGQQSLL